MSVDGVWMYLEVVVSCDYQFRIVVSTKSEKKSSIINLCVISVEFQGLIRTSKCFIEEILGHVVESSLLAYHMQSALIFVERKAVFRLELDYHQLVL